MGAIPAEIFESRHYGTVMLAAIVQRRGRPLGRGRAVRCEREAIRPRSGSHGVQHPIDASDLACSPTAWPTSSTTDWTLARALRTGPFSWMAAGYFCACLRTRRRCTRRKI